MTENLSEVTTVTDAAIKGMMIEEGLIDDDFSRDICRQRLFMCSQLEHDSYADLYSARVLADRKWDDYTTWEMTDYAAAKQCRSDLMICCHSRSMSEAEVLDVQYRWENKIFTSVSMQYVLIGTAYCANRFHFTPQSEVAIRSPFASMGATDFTYSHLSAIVSGQLTLTGCRGKLDGDRLVRSGTILFGVENLDVRDNKIDMVERCHGRYYVLFPMGWQTKTLSIIRDGKDEKILFEAHPMLTLTAQTLNMICTDSRYEGVMLWDGKVEYRCKKKPSVETSMEDGLTWEVVLDGSVLTKFRPRYGKYAISSPISQIRSCVSLGSFYKWFLKSSSASVPVKLVENSGVKIVLWRIRDGVLQFAYVKEREDKPWDLVGGSINAGETVSDALEREYFEEVHEQLAGERYYFGVNADINFCSHIYVMQSDSESPALSWWAVDVKGPSVPDEVADWLPRHFSFINSRIGSCYYVPWYCSLRSGGLMVPEVPPPLNGMDRLNHFVTRDYISNAFRCIGGLKFPIPFSVLQFRARNAGFVLTAQAMQSVRHPDVVLGTDGVYGTTLTMEDSQGNLFPSFLLGEAVEDANMRRFYFMHVASNIDRYLPLSVKIKRATPDLICAELLTWKEGRYFFPATLSELSGILGCHVDRGTLLVALGQITRPVSLGSASFLLNKPRDRKEHFHD